MSENSKSSVRFVTLQHRQYWYRCFVLDRFLPHMTSVIVYYCVLPLKRQSSPNT